MKIVTFVEKVRDIKEIICWHFNEKRILREYEEEQGRLEHEELENFSEHPSLSAEDDREPMSPEMEYWFTRCDKCGKYPEFCPCDGKFED